MMKDWSAARQRVQEVKAKNAKEGEKMSKEITSVSILYLFTSFRRVDGWLGLYGILDTQIVDTTSPNTRNLQRVIRLRELTSAKP